MNHRRINVIPPLNSQNTSRSTKKGKNPTSSPPKIPPSGPSQHNSLCHCLPASYNIHLESKAVEPERKMLRPQSLQIPFPCSLRQDRHRQRHKLATHPILPAPPPPPQTLQKQDRLQAALFYLARAAAQLPPDSAAAGSLFGFAAVSWTRERWRGEVEKAWGGGTAAVAGAGGERSGGDDGEVETRERGGARDWVRRAVGVLKREGEEGEYWRDGRDLEVLWGRVGGDCV